MTVETPSRRVRAPGLVAADIREQLHLRLNLLALLVGVIAGFGAVIFRKLIAFFHNLLFFGHFDFAYDVLRHTPASPWGAGVIAVPVVGALAVAFLVKNFAPEAKGHGVPEVMYAINYQRGIIRPLVAVIKALASSISIGSGGAVGREGPIIQIGAAFGSAIAQWTRVPEWERLALIACGAGGGIAATFNTPIGGILFAVELMLVEISTRTMIPVVLATSVATIIARLFFGSGAFFILMPHVLQGKAVITPASYIAYAVLGVLTGVVAMLFVRSIYAFEDLFDRMPGNYYTRHAFGMALVGVVIYVLMESFGHYYVQDVGYATIQDIFSDRISLAWLLFLLMWLKLLVTSLTLGSGASGGIFSPSLFIGACLGGAFALFAHQVLPSLPVTMTGAAAVGMACMVGAGTGAALTAVVMIFEMTRDYHIIIPLILAVALAYWTRRLLLAETIYTMKLSRRGQGTPPSLQSNLYLTQPALDLIAAPFVELPAKALLADIPRGGEGRGSNVALMDGDRVAAVIPASTLTDALARSDASTPLARIADARFIVADAHSSVLDLLTRFRTEGCDNAVLAVQSKDGAPAVVGVITRGDLLRSTNLDPRLAY